MSIPIALIDLFGLVCILVGAGFIVAASRRFADREALWLVLGLLSLMAFARLSDFLQWSGLTDLLDQVEDIAQVGVPLLFLVLFYGFVQARLRRELELSEEKFRSMAEQIADVLYVTDQWGTILYVSPASLRTFGLAPPAIQGRHFSDFLQETELERAKEHFELTVTSSGGAHTIVLEVRRADGTTFAGELSGVSKKEDGAVVGTIGVIRDVSFRREAERERERLEEEVRQAQKLEAVGRLAGGVAHDFNNLLTGVQGYVSLAKDALDDRELLARALEQIEKASDKAATLTRRLLTLSRKQILEPKPLQVDRVVEGLANIIERFLPGDVTLDLDLGADPHWVNGDRGALEQVVLNLVVNARDAMPSGGRLSVSTRLEEVSSGQSEAPTDGPCVVLVVRDTGHGMDRATLERVFEPFFTTKTREGGTGLGLSTVYGTVKQHGGRVTVDSEPGRGTTFRVYLPVVPPGEDAAAGEPAYEAAVTGVETLMLVEDDEQVRSVSAATLEKLGYTVLSAGHPNAALRLAAGHEGSIALLVTDIVMPGMDGRRLAERLHAARPTTKVLFMSGYADDVLGRRGILEEGVHFLAKPFRPDELARKVRAVLDGD